MTEAILERRREPRIPMRADDSAGLPLGLTVRLVDISTSGVLLASPQALELGQRARLSTTLGTGSVNVNIEVRRVSPGGDPGRAGGYRIGASFVDPDGASARSVSQFLTGATQ
jgi:hypothetical protein